MRRAGVGALLATVCAGLAVLALVAARDDRDLAFTVGVVPTVPAAELPPGETVCQTPIAVPQEFSRVRIRAGSEAREAPQLEVTVRSADGQRTMARGRLPGGPVGVTERAAAVGAVAADQKVAVCVRNAGERKTDVYGNTAIAAPLSAAYIRGRMLETDVAVVFLAREQRSTLSLVPDIFERASVFRPDWVGPWVFWVLTAAALVGMPLLLARAVAETDRAP